MYVNDLVFVDENKFHLGTMIQCFESVCGTGCNAAIRGTRLEQRQSLKYLWWVLNKNGKNVLILKIKFQVRKVASAIRAIMNTKHFSFECARLLMLFPTLVYCGEPLVKKEREKSRIQEMHMNIIT